MNASSTEPAPDWAHQGSVAEVFGVFLRLGLTSFGGPVAHLGYFHDELVQRRKWLTNRAFADVVALCQMLPGPASSQTGMAIGLHRAGLGGLVAAWLGFTLPSAALMVAFAFGLAAMGDATGSGWLLGLKAAAVAVVAQAVLTMAKVLTPDARRATIAAAAVIVVLLLPGPAVQVAAIVAGALIGMLWLPVEPAAESTELGLVTGYRRRTGVVALVLWAVLLIGLPLLVAATSNASLRLADVFYRAGSLVFGGGHVVLPLLEAQTVRTGLVGQDAFLAGYGAAQAVPGPLFTFSAFLGASTTTGPTGLLGAAIALVAIFLPAGFLVVGVLPFWERVRHVRAARRALAGVNAAVVGLLAAALYDPVFTQGITSPGTLAVAVGVFVARTSWRLPAWAAVVAAGLIGALLL